MTLSINTLEKYAKTRNTKVIAHKIADDYKSATFVLESGHKLTMTEEGIEAAIKASAPSAASTPPPDETADKPKKTKTKGKGQ